MEFALRQYEPNDEDAIVALSLRAWAPVFASMRNVLGAELDTLLHGDDWRVHQANAVRGQLADADATIWTADSGGSVVGFVVAKVADADRRIGEIAMLAVDPSVQRRGLGSTLTEFATDWLREHGMRVAVVGTGGDDGHAPARHVYEKANYTLMPIAQYFKAL